MLHILPGNEKRVSHEEAMKSEVTRSAFQKEKLAKLKVIYSFLFIYRTMQGNDVLLLHCCVLFFVLEFGLVLFT